MDLFFDNADESLLRWRMSVEEEESNIDDEDGTAEPLLKAVVRTSYLYHLRQSLRKNLESSKQKNVCDIEENMINKVIKGCSALLEEKALRNCMIARLYQRVMAQTIKEVKKATSEGQLYTLLQEFSNRQSKIPVTTFCDKEIQTDDLILPNSSSNLNEKICHTVSNFSTLKRNQLSHLPEKVKHFKTMNGVSNADRWSGQNDTDAVNGSLNSNIGSLNHRTARHENEVNINRSNGNGLEHRTLSVDIGSTDMRLLNTEFVKQETSAVSHISTNSVACKNDSFQLNLRSPSFVECVAYWYSLECELEELPPVKRQKLEEKFIRLFGNDHSIDYYFLTDEQKSITCRKRIAKHVVIELTNYYNREKIATKQLFKTMAKHITSILLGRSLFPDPVEIKRNVEEFFIDGRIIKSETDFKTPNENFAY